MPGSKRGRITATVRPWGCRQYIGARSVCRQLPVHAVYGAEQGTCDVVQLAQRGCPPVSTSEDTAGHCTAAELGTCCIFFFPIMKNDIFCIFYQVNLTGG